MIPQTNNGTAVGTTADMVARLRSTLPTGWFPASSPAPAPTATPVLDGLLAGLASAWSYCFGLLNITQAQTRVETAAGGFLDMISVDFFGSQLPRGVGESDDSFRTRIESGLLSQRGTRQDVSGAVVGMTSLAPLVCEPIRAADCGGYGGQQQVGAGGGVGYCTPGLRYSSRFMAFQYLLSVPQYAAFAPGKICVRESPATFVDAAGLIQVAAPRTLRPSYQQTVCVGPLVEARAFNLITDSRLATGFARPAGGAEWLLDYSTPGLFGTDPVMRVTGPAGEQVTGPSIDVATSDSLVAGSVWIFLDAGSTLSQVDLVMTDLSVAGSSVYASADMTQLGQWQRLSTSLQTQAAPGRNLRIGLLLTGTGGSNAVVVAQCWQVEPGQIATSYIPTSGALGIRAQDDILVAGTASAPTAFTSLNLCDAIAGTIPAATIAWTALLPAYDTAA